MIKTISTNRKAFHDFHIQDTLEAGICLVGTEVKALRQGKANLKDSYGVIKKEEIFLLNCHISPYSHGNIMNHEPLRTRKLLLHKKEIVKLEIKLVQKGYSLVALKLYFNEKGKVKVQLGLAKGKRVYEKRESIKERESQREIQRALKQ